MENTSIYQISEVIQNIFCKISENSVPRLIWLRFCIPFWTHFLQPVSWHSIEETKSNTTKANNTRTQ